MKLVIAATGASGTIYLQRLLEQIDCAAHEVHLVMSAYADKVAKQELDNFRIPESVSRHSDNDMNVPFVSGSARFEAMVIVPCSMATLGRIASGSSDSVLLRAADVFLKERQIDSRSARNAVEFNSRAQCRDLVGSRRGRSACDSIFLQPAKFRYRRRGYRRLAHSRSNRSAEFERLSLGHDMTKPSRTH